MSINDTDTSVDPVDDLDTFSADFFGQKEAEPEPASSEDAPDSEDEESDALTNEDDTQTTEEDDTLAPDDDDDTSEEDVEDDREEDHNKPKKKSRFQERIDELNGKYREEERQRKALEAKLNDLTAKLEQNTEQKPEQKVKAEQPSDNTGPNPDEKNEDGTDKYPLGEFDPNYVRDLARFTIRQERKLMEEEQKREQQVQEIEKHRIALQTSWNEKLNPAQERYPDFQEKGQQLLQTFEGIDSAYGEYLASTIMSMDFGPDVLYYLANNVDEANKIVSAGPAKATIALGRLEAKFAEADEEKQKARPRISKAPAPPAHLNKGSAVATPEVADDTDDLDAFSKKLFAKKRGG